MKVQRMGLPWWSGIKTLCSEWKVWIQSLGREPLDPMLQLKAWFSQINKYVFFFKKAWRVKTVNCRTSWSWLQKDISLPKSFSSHPSNITRASYWDPVAHALLLWVSPQFQMEIKYIIRTWWKAEAQELGTLEFNPSVQLFELVSLSIPHFPYP